MANLNKVLLMGNLTRDPEMRYLQSGSAVVNFGLAINRKYKNNRTNEMVEETTFVDIEGWGPQAETFSRYMSKGRPVYVEGRLKLDQWEDKQTGQKRSKLCIVMENFQFLGSGGGRDAGREGGRDAGENAAREAPAPVRQGGSQGGAGSVADAGKARSGEDYDFDDIPF